MNAGNDRASRKLMQWVALLRYPGQRPFVFGTVETKGFDKEQARLQLIEAAQATLPAGFEMGWWGRGQLKLVDAEQIDWPKGWRA